MSQVGGDVGGKIGGAAAGGENVDQFQLPFFTSPGGVTPEQTALADYDYGQNLTQGQAQFEGADQGGGASLSTMASQVAGGANTGKAENLGKMSDVNQGAAYSAFGNAENIFQQNNENALAEQEQSLADETSLASLAGKAAGGQASGQTPLSGSAT
jgi:hypothetical protein